ncbi:MAG: hypothetical protein CSA26_07595 [Desulfobacterales bacterium]|nr:MAG: hypothetical protein CSA26_07595 [Desulfobacterales bacterium]
MFSGKHRCSRRDLLIFAGLMGIGYTAASFWPLEESSAFLFNRKEYKIAKTRLAMGTYVSMTAIHPSKDQAEEAFGQAFNEIKRLSSILSRYHDDSAVSELNQTGMIAHPPTELQEVVSQSALFYRLTEGAFDISVKPLIDLYQSCFENNRKPTESEITAVLPRINGEDIHVEADRISFSREGMAITLDGIAKGYIVDRSSEILIKAGISNHLINAGGDIRASGTAAKGRKWTVAIQDPAKKGAYPDIISLTDGSIATSGDYEIFYDHEKIFHHIVNGKTGHSPHHSSSVSITAPTVTEADALATAVFVLGPDNGIRFIDSCAPYECLVIDRQGKKQTSGSWL